MAIILRVVDQVLGARTLKGVPPLSDNQVMECFYHAGRPTVGVCRSCMRGICRDCAADLDRGLACRERCENQVKNLLAMLEVSARSVGMAPAVRGLWQGIGVVSLLVAAFVLVWGLRLPYYREVALLSIPFLVIGFLVLKAA